MYWISATAARNATRNSRVELFTQLHLDAGLSRLALSTRLSVVMMSVGKVSVGQESYYLTAVAQGAEDYYSERGEVPGRWIGRVAGELGLAGEVDDDDFRSVLSGVDPSTRVRLRRENARVCAFDLTLSAPKSVSVLWALADEDTAAAVIAAHEVAVDAAIGYVEREAIRSRRGHSGVGQVDGDGLIRAAFRHRSSRAGDPQLHTHVVVANTTACEDGVWRTLDGRYLYAHARTAGFLYQAELRHALSQSLGVGWEPVGKGVGEVAGIPHEVLREFSRRRMQIEEGMEAGGDTSTRSARRLAVTTRAAKDYDVDPAKLEADWRERAGLHGLDPRAVQALLTESASVPMAGPMSARYVCTDGVELSDEGLAGLLTASDATFDRPAVLRVLAEHAPNGATVPVLERRAEEFLAGQLVEAVGVARTGVQYSTVELLAIEEQLLDNAIARRDDGVGVCDASTASVGRSLSAQQAAMVTKLTTDGAGISVVIGAAGTGKTYALGVAREAWEEAGHPVIGCALSARAAQELQAGSEIRSSTLHLLLAALDRPHSRGLSPGTVVVVDEAAMVGTVQLAASASTRPAIGPRSSSSATTTNSRRSKPAARSPHSERASVRVISPTINGRPIRSNGKRSPNSGPVTSATRSIYSTPTATSSTTSTRRPHTNGSSPTGSPQPSTVTTRSCSRRYAPMSPTSTGWPATRSSRTAASPRPARRSRDGRLPLGIG